MKIMKKMKVKGKLELNKKNVTVLNDSEINSVKGGATWTGLSPCFTVSYTVTNTCTVRTNTCTR